MSSEAKATVIIFAIVGLTTIAVTGICSRNVQLEERSHVAQTCLGKYTPDVCGKMDRP